MAAAARIAILGNDADLEVASRIRCILEAIPRNLAGELQVQDLRGTVQGPSPPQAQTFHPDLAILILAAEPARSFETAILALRKAWPKCQQLVVLPETLASRAIQLLESGASDFVVAPINAGEIASRVLHLLLPPRPEQALVEHLKHLAGSRQIIGKSRSLLVQLQRLPVIAGCDATVLISGETGTGKELFARAVHHLGRRAGKPFVPLDCGAIPTDLIENELFGHDRGAYTTALTAHRGLLDEAAGGSLFLDEIDSLPMSMQVKLLRFLQEKEYRPLGSTKARRADVRVIAATNIVLEEAVRAGRFRQDLFYRLNVLSLVMPPLRERREDIPLLARHFLEKYADEFSRPVRDLTEEAVRTLVEYPFPGNARELENIMERAVLACDGPLVDARILELPFLEPADARLLYQARKDLTVRNWERDELKRMLGMHLGNVSAIARAEGKDASEFRALLRKHHLRPYRASPYWGIRT